MKKQSKPRVLIFDIETAPMLAYVWGLFDQTVGLNQIHKDWHVLSWSAKWLNESKVFYMDQRRARNIEDDRRILQGIWKLLDEADIVVTQNGKRFDVKKLNARFVFHGFQPPSSFKHIDVFEISKRHFAFTSNKLEHLTHKFNKKYKKLTHRKFAGFELWAECLKGNRQAWREMEKYNKYDILSLEELYHTLSPWDNRIDFNLYNDGTEVICKCGSTEFEKRGFFYSPSGKFQRYKCKSCGTETRSKANLLSKEKRQALRPGTNR